MPKSPAKIARSAPHPPPAAPDAASAFEARAASICTAISRGDTAALADLYRARFDLVYRTARAITGRDESFGLDAAEEAFLRVLSSRRALASITTAQDLDRWLIRVVHTAAIDLIRRERRAAARELRYAPVTTAPAQPLADQIDHLRRLLDDLDLEDRHLLDLRARGHTLATIAALSHTTAPAAHGRIRRALARLSRRF